MPDFQNILDRFFSIRDSGSTVGTEVRAGLVTFMTASYIIFVQPSVMAQAGMDFGAVMTATCIASAIGCLIMGLWANYPIALAPGMGLNFYFTFTVVMGQGISWQVALGAVFLSGIGLILLTLLRFREVIINSIPESLKIGIAAGIGLFVAFIGLVQGGLVKDHPGTLVQLGSLTSLPALYTLGGVFLIGTLLQRKVKGAILIGIVAMAGLGLLLGLVEYQGLVSAPPSLGPTWMQLDILGALDLGLLTIAGVFLFVDLFDTAGTLVGIGHQGGRHHGGSHARHLDSHLLYRKCRRRGGGGAYWSHQCGYGPVVFAGVAVLPNRPDGRQWLFHGRGDFVSHHRAGTDYRGMYDGGQCCAHQMGAVG
jgi:AGZA family xanthine/uracil permease-like MFS transporter